jgi:hypothetical protein
MGTVAQGSTVESYFMLLTIIIDKPMNTEVLESRVVLKLADKFKI